MSRTDEYKDAFKGKFFDKQQSVHFAAFQQAVASREFEIDLYWKRAAYCWTFNAASFAGFFTLLTVDTCKLPDKRFFAFTVACIGLLFTLAWFFVNKGSKFWQENWENHTALLAPPIVGPLFSKVLHRRNKGIKSIIRFVHPTRPSAISVSKINQWVSFYVIVIWLDLISYVAPHTLIQRITYIQRITWIEDHPFRFVFTITVVTAIAMRFFSKTNMNPQTPDVTEISTSIYEED